MATISDSRKVLVRRLPGRKYDRYFFSAMVLLIVVLVAVGFAPKYYAAGVFRAPLPSRIIHFHAAVFSAWILLLAVQTALVSVRRVAVHRTLGVAGFFLAPLVVIFGFLAMASQLRFRASEGDTILTFSAVSFKAIFIFAVMAAMSYATRKRDTAAHKRYTLLATLGLLGAAVFRLPIPWVHEQVSHTFLTVDALAVAIAIYDLWSTHKVHGATLWGGLFLIVGQQVTIPIGESAAWHAFARWLQSWNI